MLTSQTIRSSIRQYKQLKLSILNVLLIVLSNSCCYKEYHVASILLDYKSYAIEKELTIYDYNVNEIDSVAFDEKIDLELYKHTYSLIVEGDRNGIILVLGDSIRIDTITEIDIDRYGRCNNSIDISFKHNGQINYSEKCIF